MRYKICWDAIFGIKSKHVGVVYNKTTNKVCKVINPDYDSMLDDPCWTESDPEQRMIKIKRKTKRGTIPETMSIGDCALLHRLVEEELEKGTDASSISDIL